MDVEKDLHDLLRDSDSELDDTHDKEDELTEDIFNMHQDITDRLKEAIKADETSEDIHKDLMLILKSLWTQKVGNTKKIKEKITKILRPENCKFFNVQRINEDIFGRLRDDITSQDKRLQKSQKILSHCSDLDSTHFRHYFENKYQSKQ